MIVCGTGHRPEDSEDEDIVRLKVRVKLDHTPWYGHESRVEDRELYQTLLDSASKIVYVTEVQDYPGPWVYHKRNEWMVDNSDAVMAYWSGKEAGGTYACIKYARKKNAKIANIYHDPPF